MKDEKAVPGPPGEPPEEPGEITIEFVGHEEPPARVVPEPGLQERPVEGDGGLPEAEVEISEAEGAGPGIASRETQLEDQILRLRADFANFKRRVDRDRADFLRQAKGEAASVLLPVLDDLDLATGALEPGVPEHFAQGLVLLGQRMLDALRRLGLEEIEAEGAAFDPNQHEAVSTAPRDDVPPMTVTKVFARGYRLGGKVLRPARVEVSGRTESGPKGEDHA